MLDFWNNKRYNLLYINKSDDEDMVNKRSITEKKS